MSNIAEDVEKFLRENIVDERAGAALRAAVPSTQAQVLDQGNLTDCTNPSAALMARIKTKSGGVNSSGLTAEDLRGTPEQAWARIRARNNITAHVDGGQTLLAPGAQLAAQQIAAQQQMAFQQHMQMMQYQQQVAAQHMAAQQQQLQQLQQQQLAQLHQHAAAAGSGAPQLAAQTLPSPSIHAVDTSNLAPSMAQQPPQLGLVGQPLVAPSAPGAVLGGLLPQAAPQLPLAHFSLPNVAGQLPLPTVPGFQTLPAPGLGLAGPLPTLGLQPPAEPLQSPGLVGPAAGEPLQSPGLGSPAAGLVGVAGASCPAPGAAAFPAVDAGATNGAAPSGLLPGLPPVAGAGTPSPALPSLPAPAAPAATPLAVVPTALPADAAAPAPAAPPATAIAAVPMALPAEAAAPGGFGAAVGVSPARAAPY